MTMTTQTICAVLFAMAISVESFSVVPQGVSKPLDSAFLRSQMGSAAESYYSLGDERQLLCPKTGESKGFLCTFEPSTQAGSVGDVGARATANIPDSIVRHVGIAGSVAAALQGCDLGHHYYIPGEAIVRRSLGLPEEVPTQWLYEARAAGKCLIYAVNTGLEKFAATSDLYVVSPDFDQEDVWRLSVDYTIAHINPSLFPLPMSLSPELQFRR